MKTVKSLTNAAASSRYLLATVFWERPERVFFFTNNVPTRLHTTSMKRIKLTQDKFALVDDEWFEYLNQFKWQYYSGGYAARQTGGRPPKRKTIYMHRQIMDTPIGMDTDHINGDKLDNRISNLRVVDHVTNLNGYMKLDKRNKSGYRGVSSFKGGKWRARIGRGGYLGLFNTPELAAKAIEEYKKGSL